MYVYIFSYIFTYISKSRKKKRSVKIDHNLVELTSEDDGRMKN